MAINRTPGKLALFFVRALSERRAVDGLDHLLGEPRRVFDEMLSQETANDQLGAVVLASQAHFLHALDAAWSRASLIPAFSWDAHADAADRAWHGFLTWGRLPPPLVEDLIPSYVEALPHLEKLSDLLRHRFAEHLAIISLREQQPSMGRAWVDELVARASLEDIAAFTRAVSFQLRDLPREVRIRVWDEWLRAHWEQRLKGLPRPMGEGEARQITAWAVLVDERATEAIPLACQGKSAGTYDLFFHDLERSALVENHPGLTAKFLLHVLREQQPPFYQCSEALGLATTLADSAQVEDTTGDAIREQLLRLRCE